jgi:hypothetical protein
LETQICHDLGLGPHVAEPSRYRGWTIVKMGTSRWAFKQDLAAELQIARFHSNLLERLRTGYLPYGDLEDWLRLIYLNARELEEKEKVIIGRRNPHVIL